jgi:acylglycerol lipase
MRWRFLLAALMTAACVPQEQPMRPPAGEAGIAEDIFYTADGAMLPYRSWLPEKKPRAVIVALHGFNDYSNAFDIPGQFFKEHGIAIFAYDQRGFGKGPLPGLWPGQRNLAGDLRQFTEVVSKRYSGVPLYLMGESMGGAVSVMAQTDPAFPEVDGLILVAPALWGGETMNFIYRTMLWTMAHTVPFVELTGGDLEIWASSNITMLKRMSQDPLVLKATRTDAIYGLVSLMDSAYENVDRVKPPTLLLYGACDEVIPAEPIRNSLPRFSAPLRFAHYPEGFHMLLRDLQGERVMQDILSWIDNPAAPLTSGEDRETALLAKPLDRERCHPLIGNTSGSPNRDEKGTE